jgi:6-pyruvoyltetrahydropterin/6-carboxytetrahydropterin synthase
MTSKLIKHTIMKKFEIDAGHRIDGHENKCANFHGHRYVFDVYLSCEDLDNLGRVVDFGVVKDTLGKWLDDNWDHGMLLGKDDPYRYLWESEDLTFTYKNPEGELISRAFPMLGWMKHYILPYNPTAENLSSFLYIQANKLLNAEGIEVSKIAVWETPNCYAEASL